jgi:DNA-binding Lrp family transcriptional regulator
MKAFCVKLDQMDSKLIEHLRQNARATNIELSEKVGLSPSACARRIKALEEAGVIRGYTAIINTAAAEERRPVFLHIKLTNSSDATLRKFEEAVRKCAEIREGYIVTGSSDYILKIEISDLKDFERVHAEVLTKLPALSSLETSFTIRNVFSYQKL